MSAAFLRQPQCRDGLCPAQEGYFEHLQSPTRGRTRAAAGPGERLALGGAPAAQGTAQPRLHPPGSHRSGAVRNSCSCLGEKPSSPRDAGQGVTEFHSWQQRCNSFFLLKEIEVSEILQHQREPYVPRVVSSPPPPRWVTAPAPAPRHWEERPGRGPVTLPRHFCRSGPPQGSCWTLSSDQLRC